MKKPIKFGVIGVGYLGNFHAQQLRLNKNVDLVDLFEENKSGVSIDFSINTSNVPESNENDLKESLES